VIVAFYTTLWSSSIIFFTCALLGIFFTEGSLSFCIRHGSLTDASTLQLREDFGSPFVSTLSFYKAMAGGQDWGELYRVIQPLGWVYQFAFLVFQVFSFIVLLNVVTAVFVESALQRSKRDHRFMVQTALKDNQDFLSTMKTIFRKMDRNGSGVIELAELKDQLHDKEIGAYFDSLGIDANQATNLFNLLDTDRNGSIDEDEFMFGCIRIKGEAKSLDVAIIHEEIKLSRESMFEGFKLLQANFEACLNGDESPKTPSFKRGHTARSLSGLSTRDE
jgi:hypothetical protein